MDPNRPSHLASTAVVTTLLGVFVLMFYAVQEVQRLLNTASPLIALFSSLGQGILALVVIGFGLLAMILGLITRISTSKDFPDYGPSGFALGFGLILFASPFLLLIGTSFAESQNVDPSFVLMVVLGFIALLLILALIISLWSRHIVKHENRGPKLEKQKARSEKNHKLRLAAEEKRNEIARPSQHSGSQNAEGAPEPAPAPANWNGFPTTSE